MRYAISDIHGCSKTFQLAIEKINLQKTDELFLLGDYVDRGPDSIGVMQAIWQLVADGYNVKCLRGNHEQMFLNDIQAGRGSDVIPQKHIPEVARWMMTLDYYFETPGYILVHAGLNFRDGNPLDDTYDMMWIRYWYDDIDKDWLGDRIIVHGHTPATMLQTSREIKHMAVNQVTSIDTGCSQLYEGMGYLTVLNLDTRQPTFFRSVD